MVHGGSREESGPDRESFSHLKSGRFQSIQELSRESSALRSALQKIYDQTVQARTESDRRWLIGIGFFDFIALLALMGSGSISWPGWARWDSFSADRREPFPGRLLFRPF